MLHGYLESCLKSLFRKISGRYNGVICGYIIIGQ
jgi:hypothetical protein